MSQKDLMFDKKKHLIFSTQTATTTGSVTLCMVTTVNMKMIIDEFQISFFFSVQTTLIACKRKRRMVLMDGDDDAEVSRIQPRWSFNFFFSVPRKKILFQSRRASSRGGRWWRGGVHWHPGRPHRPPGWTLEKPKVIWSQLCSWNTGAPHTGLWCIGQQSWAHLIRQPTWTPPS